MHDRRTRLSGARRLRPILLGILALLTLGGSIAGRRLADETEGLARARDLLAGRNPEAAARAFAALQGSPWRGVEARAGLALSLAMAPGAAIDGTTPGPATPALAAAIAALPLRSAMDAMLASPDPAGVLRIAELPGAVREPLLPVYQAAALVELGRFDEARALEQKAHAAFASRDLGRRVSEALEVHAQDGGLVVRDRRGRLIGTRGTDGSVWAARPETPPWLPAPALEQLQTADGAGLRLSIDLDVAAVAERALGRHRGSIVVLDPRSGEILAAASDARTRRVHAAPAFEQLREPASIMKVLTTAAALRAGRDPDADVSRMRCQGAEHYAGKVLWCSYKAGPLLSLDRAMALSCNIAFANLAISLGRPALLEELRRWGFDRVDLPGAGHIKAASGDDRQLADLAIGLEETDITPLHAALLAAAVANDGVMPEPVLLSARDGVLGVSPQALPRPPGARVVDTQHVPVLRQAMEAVADWGGTAAGVVPPGFPVAMKTGTASEWRRGYHVNYIGFAPLPSARFAFCVRATHHPSSRRARNAGKRITRDLLEGLAELHARRLVRPPIA